MANPYDQFDAPAANPYDQFDQAAGPSLPNLPGANLVEPILHTGSSILAGVPAGIASLYQLATAPSGLKAKQAAQAAQDMQQRFTYQPRTQVGQDVSGAVDTVMGLPGRAINWATGGIAENPTIKNALGASGSEYAQAGANATLNAIPALLGLRGGAAVGEAGANALRSAAPEAASPMASSQSISAAAASPSMAQVSPSLRQAVSSATARTGGAVNPETLSRHIEADTLPVPMRLTEGQATQDPVLISNEMNMRAKYPQMAARLTEQNGQLADNMQAIRDQVGPDVFTTNPVDHAETLINAYKAKNDAAQADISSRYQALKDANGGQFPVDARALLDNASAQLHQQLLFDHAPRAVMSTLGRLADNGNMTFENFESLRTNLARVMRSSPDGNQIAAAGVIRNAMEQLPLAPGAAKLKPLADTARTAAKTQFDALAADPAYKAAVNDSVPADRFINRFVLNAPRDDVATMRTNLAQDPTSLQTMGVAALDHLRDSAKIGPGGSGNFAQATFNKALAALDPKLRSLLDQKTADQLEQLGNVARYTQNQPRGSFVNNSNTAVALFGGHAAHAIEGAANVAAHGIPIGTWGRMGIEKALGGRAANKSLAPGAGLMRLQSPNQGLMGGPNP